MGLRRFRSMQKMCSSTKANDLRCVLDSSQKTLYCAIQEGAGLILGQAFSQALECSIKQMSCHLYSILLKIISRAIQWFQSNFLYTASTNALGDIGQPVSQSPQFSHKILGSNNSLHKMSLLQLNKNRCRKRGKKLIK